MGFLDCGYSPSKSLVSWKTSGCSCIRGKVEMLILMFVNYWLSFLIPQCQIALCVMLVNCMLRWLYVDFTLGNLKYKWEESSFIYLFRIKCPSSTQYFDFLREFSCNALSFRYIVSLDIKLKTNLTCTNKIEQSVKKMIGTPALLYLIFTFYLYPFL